MARIQMASKYWVQFVVESNRKKQERWDECLRNWEKIDEVMT